MEISLREVHKIQNKRFEFNSWHCSWLSKGVTYGKISLLMTNSAITSLELRDLLLHLIRVSSLQPTLGTNAGGYRKMWFFSIITRKLRNTVTPIRFWVVSGKNRWNIPSSTVGMWACLASSIYFPTFLCTPLLCPWCMISTLLLLLLCGMSLRCSLANLQDHLAILGENNLAILGENRGHELSFVLFLFSVFLSYSYKEYPTKFSVANN